jgi:hypothetical protein
VQPVNEVFFEDDDRNKYWEIFRQVLKTKNSLVFIDPDTGLETGTPSYLRKMGRDKYILNKELENINRLLDISSILMIYQHLPNNKHIHEESVYKKINQAIEVSGTPFVIAYREDDLAFLFIAKDEALFLKLSNLLEGYHINSGHVYKSIHYVPIKVTQPTPKSGVAQH